MSVSPSPSRQSTATPGRPEAALVEITPESHGVLIHLAYGTTDNVTGKVIYTRPRCLLHREAAEKLAHAVDLAADLGLRLKIWDAFRPFEAQQALWDGVENAELFVSNPATGAVPHCRGVAVDLTLVDDTGAELDMGTVFDDFRPLAFHADRQVSVTARRNRFLLLGLMSAAGWDFYSKEWWHYQLFSPREYPVLYDSALDQPLMAP